MPKGRTEFTWSSFIQTSGTLMPTCWIECLECVFKNRAKLMLHLTLYALECVLLWVFTRLKHPQAVVGCFSSVLFLQA